MKVLLVGDYSGVHSQLANDLRAIGHNVTLISSGDGYKGFQRDIDFSYKKSNSFILRLWHLLMVFLGLNGLFLYFYRRKDINSFKNYDVVQLINTLPLDAFGSIATVLFVNKLSKCNQHLFLCALGDDYEWVSKNFKKQFKYSALDRCDLKNLKIYLYSLKYVYGVFYPFCHRFVVKSCVKIIPGLVDYQNVYAGEPKLTEIVKLPMSQEIINQAKEELFKLKRINPLDLSYPILIFHGWQTGKDCKKGNDVFYKAMDIVKSSLDESMFQYKIVRNVPYKEYINTFNKADIFFDQVYSYDRGVNGVLGMSHGKVVFSGFEKEIVDSNITEIGVNATPCAESIAQDLIYLIKNKNKIISTKINALEYAIANHNGLEIAKHYINIWSS